MISFNKSFIQLEHSNGTFFSPIKSANATNMTSTFQSYRSSCMLSPTESLFHTENKKCKSLLFFSHKPLTLSFTDVPDPIKSCTISNVTAYTVHVSCLAGKDGGIPQQFHVDVSVTTKTALRKGVPF